MFIKNSLKINENVMLFLFYQAVYFFGSSFISCAIIWHIHNKSESGILLLFATICGFIPQILISLFAGVLVDKYNKKKLLIYSNLIVFTSAIIIGSLFLFKINSLVLLLILLIIRSFCSGIISPCAHSFVPEITRGDNLMKINGISAAIQSILLLSLISVNDFGLGNISFLSILFIDIIIALIGIFFLFFIKYDSEEKLNKVLTHHFIKEGFDYLKNNIYIKEILIYNIILIFLTTLVSTLTPIMVNHTFGNDHLLLDFNEILFLIGGFLGGLIVSKWKGLKNKIEMILLGCFLSGIFMILMGVFPQIIIFLITVGLTGFSVSFINVSFVTIFQKKVISSMHGRVFSIFQIFSSLILPFSMVIRWMVSISTNVKIEYVLSIIGILYLVVTGFILVDKKINYSK